MRRPCLSCLPALLMLLAISGVAPCIQASDGREVLAQEQQWLSYDGLLSVPATITLERGSRLPADCGLPPVATVWPRTLCGDTIRLLHRDSVLLRGTDCRGLLPLPTSPPCIL